VPYLSQRVILSVLLFLLTAACFVPILKNDFINFDDDFYITENAFIQQGLNAQSLRWAFTTFDRANWHPLTWISHIIDVNLFQLNPQGHHATNLILHGLNAILVFFFFGFLFKGKANLSLCFFGAALFAWHPMRVESVAWASERKDLLCAFFGLLSLNCYLKYKETPKPKPFFFCHLFLFLGLMAKAMIVTWPFVFICFDLFLKSRDKNGTSPGLNTGSLLAALKNKGLMLLGVAFFCVMTFKAQSWGGAVVHVDQFPVWVRLMNALQSFGLYLFKFLWPQPCLIFYPHMGQDINSLLGCVLGIFLSLGLFGLWKMKKIEPRYLIGGLFFLGTLIPVIGLVQVGAQSIADRYTYLPYLGLIMMLLAWLQPFTLKPSHLSWIKILLIIVLTSMGLKSFLQCKLWKDSIRIWSYTLKHSPQNGRALNGLAAAYIKRSEPQKALPLLNQAIQQEFMVYKSYYLLGQTFIGLRAFEKALPCFQEAVSRKPDFSMAYLGLGAIYLLQRNFDQAILIFNQGLTQNPLNSELHSNLGVAYLRSSRLKDALQSFEQSLKLNPYSDRAFSGLGKCLLGKKQWELSIKAFSKAIELKPENYQRHYLLGLAAWKAKNTSLMGSQLKILRAHRPALADQLIKLQGKRLLDTLEGAPS